MDIGDFISANEAPLRLWGERVASTVQDQFGLLLKVPAQVRVKTPVSARAKQLKKNYSNPEKQMTDLVGARFVVLTSMDLEPIRSFLEGNTDWIAVQARDPDEEIARDPATFSYQSHHYEVRPRKALDIEGHNIPETTCCEVQVRTLLQHAYAELTHDSLYKPAHAVPSQSQRLVARSMALMETTDELLCSAIRTVREANEPALALQSKAKELVASLGKSSSQDLLALISDTYRSEIKPTAARELQAFFEHNSFIHGLLRSRLGRTGLFSFPDAALITYWLSETAQEDLLQRWPLPSALKDVQLVMSDMGLA